MPINPNGQRKPITIHDPSNGRLLGTAKRNADQAKEDFMSRVVRKGPDECWEWSGGKMSHEPGRNYGSLGVAGKMWKAHRMAWFYENGPIPQGLSVLHKCDNPPCCNPSHLFLGTGQDNMRDCISKGRAHRECGEDRYNATLTADIVREIRRRYKPRHFKHGASAMGREFGVGTSMIFAIIHRLRWKHVT